MPRQARVAPGGMVFHVLNRTAAGLPLFRKEKDYEAFARIMVEATGAPPADPRLVFDAKSLALCRVATQGRGADGLLSLAGAYPRHALARGAPRGWWWALVPGPVPELPGPAGRARLDPLPLRGAACLDGGCGEVRGEVAMGQPFGAIPRRRQVESDLGRLARVAAAKLDFPGQQTIDERGSGEGSGVDRQKSPLWRPGLAGRPSQAIRVAAHAAWPRAHRRRDQKSSCGLVSIPPSRHHSGTQFAIRNCCRSTLPRRGIAR